MEREYLLRDFEGEVRLHLMMGGEIPSYRAAVIPSERCRIRTAMLFLLRRCQHDVTRRRVGLPAVGVSGATRPA